MCFILQLLDFQHQKTAFCFPFNRKFQAMWYSYTICHTSSQNSAHAIFSLQFGYIWALCISTCSLHSSVRWCIPRVYAFVFVCVFSFSLRWKCNFHSINTFQVLKNYFGKHFSRLISGAQHSICSYLTGSNLVTGGLLVATVSKLSECTFSFGLVC